MNRDPLNRRTMLGTLAGGPVALAAMAAAAAEEGRNAGRILIPIGDATEALDTLYPFFRVQEDGYEVVVAGPGAEVSHGAARNPARPDVPGTSPKSGRATTCRPLAFRDVKPEEYAGLFVSGGRAPDICATTRT